MAGRQGPADLRQMLAADQKRRDKRQQRGRQQPAGEEGWHAYFVHSFHVAPENDDHLIATTDYGGPVTAVIGRDNIVGTQFHPEKSQKLGLALLGNFLRWAP